MYNKKNLTWNRTSDTEGVPQIYFIVSLHLQRLKNLKKLRDERALQYMVLKIYFLGHANIQSKTGRVHGGVGSGVGKGDVSGGILNAQHLIDGTNPRCLHRGRGGGIPFPEKYISPPHLCAIVQFFHFSVVSEVLRVSPPSYLSQSLQSISARKIMRDFVFTK